MTLALLYTLELSGEIVRPTNSFASEDSRLILSPLEIFLFYDSTLNLATSFPFLYILEFWVEVAGLYLFPAAAAATHSRVFDPLSGDSSLKIVFLETDYGDAKT